MRFFTVGFAGQMGVGKDVATDYLCQKLNGLGDVGFWQRKGFALAVKRIFMETFQVDYDFIEKWKRIDSPPPGFDLPVRHCLIQIGDGFRQMKNNIWIELAFRNQIANHIINDVRYINETNTIRDHGGFSVLVWRPGFENDIPNASEQQLMPYIRLLSHRANCDGAVSVDESPFDFFLVNNGSIEELYHKIDEKLIPPLLKKIYLFNSSQSQDDVI